MIKSKKKILPFDLISITRQKSVMQTVLISNSDLMLLE